MAEGQEAYQKGEGSEGEIVEARGPGLIPKNGVERARKVHAQGRNSSEGVCACSRLAGCNRTTDRDERTGRSGLTSRDEWTCWETWVLPPSRRRARPDRLSSRSRGKSWRKSRRRSPRRGCGLLRRNPAASRRSTRLRLQSLRVGQEPQALDRDLVEMMPVVLKLVLACELVATKNTGEVLGRVLGFDVALEG